VKIISKNDSVFDGFVAKGLGCVPDAIARNIEAIDLSLYSAIDHSRFKVVKKKERTIMTTAGPVTYSRRCYKDSFSDLCLWPTDSVIGVAPRAKVSNELKRRLVENAAEMTYSMAGAHSCFGGSVSKSTVCRAVRDCGVEKQKTPGFGECTFVHLQIDEKYMGYCGSRHKKPRYTATLHCGSRPIGKKGNRKRLEKRRILSAETPAKLAKKVNRSLSEDYGLGIEDRVWVSGDLASYIRNFTERIKVCESVYVPDKWHVCKAVSDAYPEFGWVPPSAVRGILDAVIAMGDLSRLEKRDGIEIVRLYKKDPSVFDRWDEEGYAGCSQEGMNSHYYAPRFAKLASRFKPSTVEKLCAIIECKRDGIPFLVTLRATPPADLKELPWLGKPYEDRAKWAIDTSEMREGMRKIIDEIKYGGIW
jgi:hypothetical protein